jgi:signal transduction histidine kinase
MLKPFAELLSNDLTSKKDFVKIAHEKAENFKAADLLSKMNNQIDKLNHLIVDLLDITKVDKGEMIFDFEEFDFNKLVEVITEEVQRTTQTHCIKLHLLPAGIIMGDENRIGQVITNLITNAIKYSPASSEVIVESTADNQNVKLCVKDFGIGIPQDEQSKIFNRFHRVHGKNKHNTFPGLGLGLYISSQIIKKHTGTLKFDSIEDQGSTFCFTLPRTPST